MPESDAWQLTSEETALVERFLDFYRDLDSGRRLAATEAQRHFVAVCRCEAKAQSEHEVAYFKYRLLVNQARGKTQSAAQDDIDELGEGVPQPGWITDEDWKRMRGQYRSNSD